MKSILIVDDEIDLRNTLVKIYENRGYKAYCAEDMQSALDTIQKEPIDLVISDIKMPNGTGLDLLEQVKATGKKLKFILISGFSDVTEEEALKRGALALVKKPVRVQKLLALTERYLADPPGN